MGSEIQEELLKEIKNLCGKYGLEYVRCDNIGRVTGVEVRLKSDVVFWVESSGQIIFSSTPWKIKVDELVRMTSFSHKVAQMLSSNWKAFCEEWGY